MFRCELLRRWRSEIKLCGKCSLYGDGEDSAGDFGQGAFVIHGKFPHLVISDIFGDVFVLHDDAFRSIDEFPVFELGSRFGQLLAEGLECGEGRHGGFDDGPGLSRGHAFGDVGRDAGLNGGVDTLNILVLRKEDYGARTVVPDQNQLFQSVSTRRFDIDKNNLRIHLEEAFQAEFGGLAGDNFLITTPLEDFG